MTEIQSEEAPFGEELIRISLEAYEVRFFFTRTILHVGARFVVGAGGIDVAEIRPEEQRGQIERLWRLIGDRVQNVSWPDSPGATITLSFSRGDYIEIVSSENGQIRGTILDKHEMIFDDF